MTNQLKTFKKNFLNFEKDCAVRSDDDTIVPFIIHSKKRNGLFDNPNFWVSNYPQDHLATIYKSELKIPFLLGYLSNDEFFNEELNDQLYSSEPKLFFKLLKFSKVFLGTKHSEWIRKKDQKSAIELDFIKKHSQDVRSKEETTIQKIISFDIAHILMAFVIALDTLKAEKAGAFAELTRYEIALFELISKILSTYGKKNDTLEFNYQSFEDLTVKTSDEASVKQASQIIELSRSLIQVEIEKNRIDLFCVEFFEIKKIEGDLIQFEQTIDYDKFISNNRKVGPEEFYTSNSSYLKSLAQNTALPIQLNGIWEEDYFKFYNYPTTIHFGGVDIDLTKVWKLQKHLSIFKGPDLASENYETASEFRRLFGSREPISIFSKEDFTSNVSIFFNWSLDEAHRVIDFISYNPLIDKKKKWYYNPLLILNDKIIWIGSYMSSRKFSVLTFNKLKTETNDASVKLISTRLEEKCAEVFHKAGYKTQSGLKFKTPSNNRRGDIDLIAYKKGELIIGEVKLGNISDDFNHSALTEINKLEGLAAEQLDKIVEYVKEDWESLKERLGLETRKRIEQIRITPIIITNHFEGDLKHYKNHLKVSLLELVVILNNNSKKLFFEYFKIDSAKNLTKLIRMKDLKINYDLWNGKKRLNHNLLLDNIKENKLWEPLRQYWLE